MPSSSRPARGAALALLLVLAASAACSSPPTESTPEPAPDQVTPDRLAPEEPIAEAPTAFGMPLPPGMRLTRHFADSAYFSGNVKVEQVLEHLREHALLSEVQMRTKRALIPRAHLRGDASRRLFRIEVEKIQGGSQLLLKDITPPPPVLGLSEAERWRRAGRNPDGSMVNPKELL